MKRPLTLDSPYGDVTWGGEPQGAAHLRAESPEGAFWALGWWQSRVAGDQALFARALWRSRLGESKHAGAGHAEVDALTRSWRVDAHLDAEVESLSAGDRAALHAFTRGFAAQQASRPAWPWRQPEYARPVWTAEDGILLARTLGLMSWWETRGALQRELWGWMKQGLDWKRLTELLPELGDEPDRRTWSAWELPPVWSPDAWEVIHGLHRWRPGTLSSGPAWGITAVCDVTEPGLPYLEVVLETPEGTSRGLCLPGLPALLTGRNERVAWHVEPSLGDIVHTGVLDGRLTSTWVGAAPTWADTGSTLAALLAPLRSTSASALVDEVEGHGTAALRLVASDRTGDLRQVELGWRWKRAHPRDAWLPARDVPEREPAPPSSAWAVPRPQALAAADAAAWKALVSSGTDLRGATLLPELRFLLPEDGDARRLKLWSGRPTSGPEARLFQRLVRACWRAFWATAGLELPPEHPASALLWSRVEALLTSAHSAWLPARDKNAVLAQAVRGELLLTDAETADERPGALHRLAHEALGEARRTLAATVAVTVDWSRPELEVFLTDDETEPPRFHRL